MRKLRTIGFALLTALALAASVGAGSAAATTLEVGGVVKNEALTLNGSLKPGTSANFKATSGESLITCTGFEMHGKTEAPYSGAQVGGAASTWAYSGCNQSITNHKPGRIYGEHIKGTTNGTFFSTGAETTAYSALFGTYLNCKTGTGTHMGTVTGVASGHATVHINAVVNCGLLSAKLEGIGVITSPTGFGVSA
jgi:hypothetical protein